MPDLAQEDVSIDADTIATMLTRIYRGKYGDDGTKSLDRGLFEATHETFNRATASGIADAVNRGIQPPSAQFLELLDRNNAIFSAFRTHKMQKDVASLLLDEKGKIKKFADFKRDVAPVVGKYNGSWLRTEYATAVQRSRLATKWQQFVDEQDVFPNLEWVQSTALHPGEDHRIFWFTVRPVDDPFWTHHRPGDRWNCQCDLRQTNLPPTDIPTVPINDTKNSPAPGLDNNPGTDGQLFNDRHPYFPKNCTSCPFANMGKKLMALSGWHPDDCRNCKAVQDAITGEIYKRVEYPNGGLVECPTKQKQNGNERVKNKRAAHEVAKKLGKKYRIETEGPDLLDLDTGDRVEVKVPVSKKGQNAIQPQIRKAHEQGSQQVIIYLTQEYETSDLLKGFKAAFYKGRAAGINTVIIRYNNGDIIEYNADNLNELHKEKAEE